MKDRVSRLKYESTCNHSTVAFSSRAIPGKVQTTRPQKTWPKSSSLDIDTIATSERVSKISVHWRSCRKWLLMMVWPDLHSKMSMSCVWSHTIFCTCAILHLARTPHGQYWLKVWLASYLGWFCSKTLQLSSGIFQLRYIPYERWATDQDAILEVLKTTWTKMSVSKVRCYGQVLPSPPT